MRKIRRNRKITSINYGVTMEHISRRRPVNIWGIVVIILILAFIAGGAYYAYFVHQQQGEEIQTIDLGEPTLPRIAFIEAGYQVNELVPYTNEMDILTMRDTISPLSPQGNLDIKLVSYEWDINKLSYRILSEDGTSILKEGIETEWEGDIITLSLASVVPKVGECLMELSTTLSDGRTVYYYTRLMAYNSCYMSNNLDVISGIHEQIMSKDTTALSKYFSKKGEESSLQELTLNSGIESITWGSLEPTMVGDVKWKITECTELFMSVQLEYQVEIQQEYYNIVESYRSGYSTSKREVQIKQYNRTMNQVFQINDSTLVDKGINLGIVDEEALSYKANEEGNEIAFVHGRSLYSYQLETNEMVRIYSLEETPHEDDRYRNSQYDIKILGMDEEGDLTFAVYGYMNRGVHEGSVGTGIFCYDAENKLISEKAFVSMNQSYAVGKEEMSHGIYYSETLDYLYLIAQHSLYEIHLLDDTQNILAKDIQKADYEISQDGKIIAYNTKEDGSAPQCRVLDFETGASYTVMADEGANIAPLGFLYEDFIYGMYRDGDALLDEGHRETTPMYKIEIRNTHGKVEITYEKDTRYIRDVYVKDNMVTMNLLEVVEGLYAYAGQDVITNNEAQNTSNIELINVQSEELMKQKVLSIPISTEEKQAGVKGSSAQLASNEEAIYIYHEVMVEDATYYAYAYGKLQVASTMASDAIQYASANMGSVVNENHEYVWRSGYRNLSYMLPSYSDIAVRLENGETAIAIVSEKANQNPVSYTGCTMEQMCYLINQNQMIAAKLDDNSWVMLIGYNRNTLYYLSETGRKKSTNMAKLDDKVMELIGDGIY